MTEPDALPVSPSNALPLDGFSSPLAAHQKRLPACDVAIIGAGPAGLMAAEVLAQAGRSVVLLDASASVGRKFLLAGKGGLNLTHSEPLPAFLHRYDGDDLARKAVADWVNAFPPEALRAWCKDLGVETFVGSSGRVFPSSMKAAPLLRAWLHRLRGLGVHLAMRHRWQGWTENGACLVTHAGQPVVWSMPPKTWLLATGGGSWARLGSDGAWWPWLAARGVSLSPLMASNVGYTVGVKRAGAWSVGWSEHLRSRHAGAAIKNVAAMVWPSPVHQAGERPSNEPLWTQRGEFILTDQGIEGNLVYAAAAALRRQWQDRQTAHPTEPSASLGLNLLPAWPTEKVIAEVTRPRGPRSWSTHLKSRLNLEGAKLALLHELLPKDDWQDPLRVAQAIVALPVALMNRSPMDEAISTAGGVRFDAVTPDLSLRALPAVFCAGEMLDWDAPTGGYLLTACMASGRWAAQGILRHLSSP